MRIVHLSDIHVWHYTWNVRRLWSKRTLGMVELLSGRASKFRLERLDEVIERAASLDPDHFLITGDITTTALPSEFEVALQRLQLLLKDPQRVTIVPGNHDRYTGGAFRSKRFEASFGRFMPQLEFPWLRPLKDNLVILGLDATRPHLTARGRLSARQLAAAKELVATQVRDDQGLVIACHYPVAAPAAYQRDLAKKRMSNAPEVRAWLETLGPHLFCCGHVHAAWAFNPSGLPLELCINAGAPLLRDPTGLHHPGFVEIVIKEGVVSVTHHAWNGRDWQLVPLAQQPVFVSKIADTARS